VAVPIDIEIDKLTNSIENRISGEVFDTVVSKFETKDSRFINKKDWLFDWKAELKEREREVFKLTTVNNPKIVHGLLSIEDRKDHIYMHLIESARFNVGEKKLYLGIPGNLVAFACKRSFEKGYDGYLVFLSKTRLVNHYMKTLGGRILYGNYMAIETTAARSLVEKYYKH